MTEYLDLIFIMLDNVKNSMFSLVVGHVYECNWKLPPDNLQKTWK
jgi:hypothetical protein